MITTAITRSQFQAAIEDGIATLEARTPADYARLAARLRRVGREASTCYRGSFGPWPKTDACDPSRPGCPLTKAGVGPDRDNPDIFSLGFVEGFYSAFDSKTSILALPFGSFDIEG